MTIQAPHAATTHYLVPSPHGTRADPYFWLRDDTRTNPEVIAYLQAENAYREICMASHAEINSKLYQEIIDRIAQDDESVPVRQRGFWYYTRFIKGSEYPIYLRRRDLPQEIGANNTEKSTEEVLLDCNELAVGHSYFSMGNYEVSPNNLLLAYAQDTVGRRQYSIVIKELTTGMLLPEILHNVEPDIAWANDNRSFFYLEKDSTTLLAVRVRRHVLGTDPHTDAVVYQESDDTFTLALAKTKSDRYVLIGSESTVSSEWRYLDADRPAAAFQIVLPRERDHEYQIEHAENEWLIRTNWQANNFRLIAAPLLTPNCREQWRDVVAHDPAVFIHDFSLFKNHVAISIRSEALRKLRLYSLDGKSSVPIDFNETAYCAKLGANVELHSDRLRLTYTSLTTPVTTYDYHLHSGELSLLKREPVLGDFNPSHYVTELVWAQARDGEQIPVSLLYKQGLLRDGRAPLYQYAYGAYGHSSDPIFGAARLSLIDRGFIYAIAHVRGGQELGRRWYDDGRLHHKMNTFNDFLDVTKFLVANNYAARDQVYAAGGSAGGLLVGAVINLAPELYRGVVAHVPFVDVVTTMLDESIPLTTLEYDEWGNPNNAADYEYMLKYSPYDNVSAQPYPAILVTAGFWDSQVQYFEPAKWVAKLRATKTDSQPLYLYMDMEAGHGGKSGRLQRYREIALEYTFILSLHTKVEAAATHNKN